MRSLIFSTALLASLSLAPLARAETSPAPYDAGCMSAYPVIGKTAPANIPGIPFQASYSMALTSASLTAPDGTVVPTKIAYEAAGYYESTPVVLALGTTLAADTTYTLRWGDGCGGGTRTFTTTASVPMPTSAGTISVGDLYPATYCVGGVPGSPARRDVFFVEDAALVPFLPIARVDLVVDGKVDGYGGKPFGHFKESDSLAGMVMQSCPAAPRTVRVAVQVKIANGPTLITPEVTTELRCADEIPEGCPDTGVPDPGVAEDSGISFDPDDAAASPSGDDAGAAAATPPRDDVVVGGCTCDVPRAASSTPWLLLIVLPLAARRRARRTH